MEVYSNLVDVTDEMWELFQSPRVSLAFSYFAKDASAHNAVTGRPSHKATRRNAEKAARLGIPIRAGVIDFGHVQEAVSDLNSIGVTKVATDGFGASGAVATTPRPDRTVRALRAGRRRRQRRRRRFPLHLHPLAQRRQRPGRPG